MGYLESRQITYYSKEDGEQNLWPYLAYKLGGKCSLVLNFTPASKWISTTRNYPFYQKPTLELKKSLLTKSNVAQTVMVSDEYEMYG